MKNRSELREVAMKCLYQVYIMQPTKYTDLILTKIERIKEIEDHDGATSVSEGIDANYMDILNYAVFAIIKLTETR